MTNNFARFSYNRLNPFPLVHLDYYPFGMMEPGRNFNSSEYRFGFDGQEKVDEISGEGNHNTALFWEYDTRLGRRWNPDPIVKYNEGSYNAFSNNPIWLVDPLGDDTLVFGENNKFSKTIKAEGDPTGKKEGKDGFTFTFADPVHDPKDIGNDPGQIGELFIVSDQSITKDLDRAGVNEEENKGPVDGPWFLLNHSNYGKNDGKTDFYNTSKILGKDGLDEGKLYITKVDDKTVAHNAHNFGNFLWGAAANSVEVSLKLSLWGANFNNYLNAKENANKKWSEKTGDSKDDKYSISLGWQWRQNKRTK